ncbi:EamA family transporter [Tunturibacter empetritectus]|uniref:Drug/metabolite transporter (DMT)-like permease n=1 Tax=Tunturiibacter empetritectus TaxID=3069691 RepID=A0A7W8MTJ9_9BACT|nr:EamA family transporter [Edaphobacter lichenicola]MBB5318269.1 drug/metabolite transporter (DMT)-like permease [Edaphobacter lichenicola]
MPVNSTPNRTRILLCFACVYLFWGSTYLAMRYGVEVLPPFVLGSVRFLLAGVLMLAASAALKRKMWPNRQELARLVVIGVLMLGCGNTSVIWAEQYLPTGLAALLVAVVPLYAALIEIVLPRGEGLRAKGWVGICIGFAGIVFLLWPGLREGLRGDSRQIVAAGVTLGGAMCWTGASVISRRSTFQISGFAAAGWEMLFGGVFNALMLVVTKGYHGAQWGLQAWASTLYLVAFGSILTYSAYVYLLDHVAVSKVATYAYVNPVIAVILGVILLKERFVAVEYVGMAAILVAVFLVTSSKMKSGAATVVDEDVAAGLEA